MMNSQIKVTQSLSQSGNTVNKYSFRAVVPSSGHSEFGGQLTRGGKLLPWSYSKEITAHKLPSPCKVTNFYGVILNR